MRKIHITRLATVAGVTGAVAVAAIAFASGEKAAPTAAAAAPAVQSLPYAQFVSAPEHIVALHSAKPSQSAQGMRAYIDLETKQFRPATQAELNEAAAAAPTVTAAAKAAVPAAPSSSTFVSAAQALKSADLANGPTKIVLDESYMSYAVATVGKDGKVKQACLENQPNEKAALSAAEALQGADRHEK